MGVDVDVAAELMCRCMLLPLCLPYKYSNTLLQYELTIPNSLIHYNFQCTHLGILLNTVIICWCINAVICIFSHLYLRDGLVFCFNFVTFIKYVFVGLKPAID